MSDTIDYGKFVRPQKDVMFDGKSYVLKKANSGPISEFNDLRLKAFTITGDGSRIYHDPNQLKFKLLSVCLVDDKGNPVPIHFLKSWPDEVINDLFKRAKDICNIDTDTNSNQKDTLKKALNDSGPIKFAELKDWAERQDPIVLGWFADFFKETSEEEAKNLPDDSTDSLE